MIVKMLMTNSQSNPIKQNKYIRRKIIRKREQ